LNTDDGDAPPISYSSLPVVRGNGWSFRCRVKKEIHKENTSDVGTVALYTSPPLLLLLFP